MQYYSRNQQGRYLIAEKQHTERRKQSAIKRNSAKITFVAKTHKEGAASGTGLQPVHFARAFKKGYRAILCQQNRSNPKF